MLLSTFLKCWGCRVKRNPPKGSRIKKRKKKTKKKTENFQTPPPDLPPFWILCKIKRENKK